MIYLIKENKIYININKKNIKALLLEEYKQDYIKLNN
jgi:hypothetical protein